MSEGKHPGGRPPLFDNIEDLQNKIDEYFDQYTGMVIMLNSDGEPVLTKSGTPVYEIKPPTITGLSYFLGFESRQSMYDYENNEKFSYTIKKARLRCEMFAEQMLYQIRPAGPIFALKNFGWTDKQIIEHSGAIKTNMSDQEKQDQIDNIMTILKEEFKNSDSSDT